MAVLVRDAKALLTSAGFVKPKPSGYFSPGVTEVVISHLTLPLELNAYLTRGELEISVSPSSSLEFGSDEERNARKLVAFPTVTILFDTSSPAIVEALVFAVKEQFLALG